MILIVTTPVSLVHTSEIGLLLLRPISVVTHPRHSRTVYARRCSVPVSITAGGDSRSPFLLSSAHVAPTDDRDL